MKKVLCVMAAGGSEIGALLMAMQKTQASMLRQIQSNNQRMIFMQEKLLQYEANASPEQPLRRSESAPAPGLRHKLRRSPRKHPGTPCKTPEAQHDNNPETPGATLQRRLSFSGKGNRKKRPRSDGDEEQDQDDGRGRKKTRRTLPTDDMRRLRHDLGAKLRVFDQELVAGKFQDHENPKLFDPDLFGDACRGIIKDLLEDDYEEHHPTAFKIARDIAKKRRAYLINKAQKAQKAETEKKNAKKKKKNKKKLAAPKKEVQAEENKKVISFATSHFFVVACTTHFFSFATSHFSFLFFCHVTLFFSCATSHFSFLVPRHTFLLLLVPHFSFLVPRHTFLFFCKKVIVEQKVIDVEQEEADLDNGVTALFDDSDSESGDRDGGRVQSYQCYRCNEHIESLDQCFPENQRHLPRSLFLCRDCHLKTENAILVEQVQESITRDEGKAEIEEAVTENKSNPKKRTAAKTPNPKKRTAAKTPKPKKRTAAKTPKPKKATAAKTPKPKKATAAKTTNKGKWEFDLHSNVLCKYDGKFYPAQVFGRYKGKYHVYFPDDRFESKNVHASDLKSPPLPLPDWAKCDRKRFFHMSFKHNSMSPETPEVYGSFTVERLGKGKTANKYLCRLDGNETEEYWFDVGYVSNKLLMEIFPSNPCVKFDRKAKKMILAKSFFAL